MGKDTEMSWVARAHLVSALQPPGGITARRLKRPVGRGRITDPTVAAGIAVDVFEAVGLFADDEAARWRECLATPVDDGSATVAVTEEARRNATAALEQLLATLGPFPEGERHGEAVTAIDAFRNGLSLLGRLGVLDAAGALAWGERAAIATGTEALWRRSRERARIGRCTARELIAVLPGPPPAPNGNRVIAVERYGDGVICHCWLPASPPMPAPGAVQDREQMRAFFAAYRGTLIDDVGTEYVTQSSSGSPRRTFVFGGTVPDAAQRLTVSLPDSEFTVRLR